ncbi:dihydroorotase [Flavobacteriales bacterium]|nr:dihydroorotase [Flavobacteriales bacterium]
MNHLFTGAILVHEGRTETGDLLVEGDRIKAVGPNLIQHTDPSIATAARQAVVHDCKGLHLLPGLIDDQVHFREPGLTHKAEIATESKAAVAGGITSFMEMPNTVPQSLTQELLQDKYDRAAEVSPANYSFYMGASNGNLDQVLLTDPRTVCGVKVFMGSSTGDMLVDDAAVLEGIFKECPMLIATHCEDEATIRANAAAARAQFGDDVPIGQHPIIRSAEACYRSSSRAVELAARTGARLHVLHISTAQELRLFDGSIPLSEKRITAEACTHHLWFTDADYAERGTHIKWNPAVKTAVDRDAVRAALKPGGAIDVLATDHAPHTRAEKANGYWSAPSGGPLVQHALVALYEGVAQGWLQLTDIPRLASHRVAELFDIEGRGFLRPGYFADFVLVNPNASWTVTEDSILSKCGWSPFTGDRFSARVVGTWVNGTEVWDGERVLEPANGDAPAGRRMTFNR